MPTVIKPDYDENGNLIYVEYNETWIGDKGPFLTRVGQVMVDPETGDPLLDGEGDPIPVIGVRTSSQIDVEAAPTSDTHVMRRQDLTSGVIEEITFGTAGVPKWRFRLVGGELWVEYWTGSGWQKRHRFMP